MRAAGAATAIKQGWRVKTLYLHVGAPKTGSSAIQQFIFQRENVGQFLNANGILPSNLGQQFWNAFLGEFGFGMDISRVIRHLTTTPECMSRGPWEFFALNLKRMTETGYQRFFVSQEGLMYLQMFNCTFDGRPWMETALEPLLGTDARAKIMLLVRRQDTFLESLYIHYVKRGYTGSFESFIDGFPVERLDWHALAQEYAALPGVEEVWAAPFEGELLRKHLSKHLFEAFVNAMELDITVNVGDETELKGKLTNPSVAPDLIPLSRWINEHLPAERATAINEMLAYEFSKRPGTESGLLTTAQRRDLLARFDQSNRQFFRTFVPWAPESAYAFSDG